MSTAKFQKFLFFVSEKVRGKISRYNDEEITHLDYFKRRMKKLKREI